MSQRMRAAGWIIGGAAGWLLGGGFAAGGELQFRPQELDRELGIGYAVLPADVNGDGKPDIVVVDSDRILWYENPSWKRRVMIQGVTERDNVCIDARDIDGDGQLDFALGAHWQPKDTSKSGSLHWLRRGKTLDEPWSLHHIDREPTIHRIRWIDLEGDGKSELVVVPLFGRNTVGPEFQQAPLRVLAYDVPADPVKDRWPQKVLNEDLHVAHNFTSTDLNRDGKLDLLLVSFEGVSLLERGPDRWLRTLIGTGNQQTRPNRGASEIKYGRVSEGVDYIATIEPWHGTQVAVYTRPPAGTTLWERHIIDEQLQWGHAVWCADLDGDKSQELVIGVRDHRSDDAPCGVRIYRPAADAKSWTSLRLDPGGVAVEDLAAADFDGDGRTDLVACGRQTKNLRIYWNETARGE